MIDRSDELREMYANETDDLLAAMFNGAWLDTQVFPPLEYSVPGILPECFGLLVSPPKAGKSWLVCGIGLACAIGGLALGRISVGQRPVLYLALEDGQRRLQSRWRHIMCNEPIPAGIHFIMKSRPAEVIPMITEFLQRYSDEKPLAGQCWGDGKSFSLENPTIRLAHCYKCCHRCNQRRQSAVVCQRKGIPT